MGKQLCTGLPTINSFTVDTKCKMLNWCVLRLVNWNVKPYNNSEKNFYYSLVSKTIIRFNMLYRHFSKSNIFILPIITFHLQSVVSWNSTQLFQTAEHTGMFLFYLNCKNSDQAVNPMKAITKKTLVITECASSVTCTLIFQASFHICGDAVHNNQWLA